MSVNTNLVQLIKTIAEQARETAKPCDFTYGVVESVNPLSVKMNKFTLPSDFLIITMTASRPDYLHKGDTVLMIRKEGGQQYAVIDKVVDV